jgi:hypothetical protein
VRSGNGELVTRDDDAAIYATAAALEIQLAATGP